MRYEDIKPFTQSGTYEVNVRLLSVARTIREYEEMGLKTNPDFQRGHVWTVEQQARYMEYVLRGGRSATVIYFNKPSWNLRATTGYDDFVLVDGLQRITTIINYFKNKVPIFDGRYARDFEDEPRDHRGLRFNVNDLQSRAEVLDWYIGLNAGGVVHSVEEIARVRAMLEQEKA